MSIPDEWKFPGRDYPAAKDHINSLLNFGYYVLEQEIWAAYGHSGARMRAVDAWAGVAWGLLCAEAGVHHVCGLSRGIEPGMITGWRWARRSDGVMCQSPD